MGRIKLKLKNWPFEKGQKVQLIWSGEPFKENNKWMIDTYFCDGKVTKKVIQDWANIHFLSIDKYYTDGDLNSGEIIDDEGTINIDLSNIMPKYNESDWNIKKSNYKSKSKTFSFWKNNILYTIPVIEIVRAVLAPNLFMLNTILYNDIWEEYFLYNFEGNKLKLTFSNEYRTTCLKSEYYNHLAWMLTNPEILNMYNEIGYNMFTMNGFKFDFNIPKFKIKARVKKNNYGFTIVEILNVYGKEIKVNELEVYHPSFENKKKTDEHKKKVFIGLNNDNEDRVIDNSVDGSSKSTESIDDESIIHEYTKIPIIKKEKSRDGVLRKGTDDKTIQYMKDDRNIRTLSLDGGLRVAKGLEFMPSNQSISYELEKFIYNLKQLEKLDWIEKVEIKIINLPLGRRISYLSNGIDRRRCIIAEITKNNKEKFGIIEVEREKISLSTLILNIYDKAEFYCLCRRLLEGLIYKSGKWSSKIIGEMNKNNIEVKRNYHINANDAIRNIINKIM